MRFTVRAIGILSVSVGASMIVASSIHAEDVVKKRSVVQISEPGSYTIVQPCDSCQPARKGIKGFLQRWRDGVLGTSDTSRTLPSGLPQGRTYYNGRYFGNFNNRFYGPQYGYF